MMTVPNMLTMARIAMVPAVVGLIYLPEAVLPQVVAQSIAMALFVAAALTDWLDGYLARTLKQTSSWGAFADPVADKLMVSVVLILLVHMGRLHSVAAMVIIAREIAISALREWMATLGKGAVVAVASIGKVKTAIQMIAVPFLLVDFRIGAGVSTVTIGSVLMWLAVLLTLWSMADYLRAAAKAIRGFEGDRDAGSSASRVVSVGS